MHLEQSPEHQTVPTKDTEGLERSPVLPKDCVRSSTRRAAKPLPKDGARRTRYNVTLSYKKGQFHHRDDDFRSLPPAQPAAVVCSSTGPLSGESTLSHPSEPLALSRLEESSAAGRFGAGRAGVAAARRKPKASPSGRVKQSALRSATSCGSRKIRTRLAASSLTMSCVTPHARPSRWVRATRRSHGPAMFSGVRGGTVPSFAVSHDGPYPPPSLLRPVRGVPPLLARIDRLRADFASI